MDAHLELVDVSKRYARTVAVDRLSLSVPRGAVYGLLGPNGAGKTTTIRMVMRITLPDSGEIRLGGRVIDDDVREAIGYLPEERGLYRRMKVLDQLAYLGEVRGLARPEARRRAAAWLEKLGLAGKADARVEELSKGMQQKVQFAGAVIHGPEFVILDEPFTGLDPIATRQLKDELLAMAGAGTTVLLSTHVLPQAEELCDHICLINRGRPILQGALAEVRGRFVKPALKVVSPAADAELAAVPGVAAVRQGDGGRIVELAAGAAAPAVIRSLAAALPLEAVAPLAETLEDIFLRAVEADHAAVA
ncbi:MAG TPA: ATP-binding cassette domain-containing protein [Thermoanaerobaculaceae bacterium]|nr:ATP-binding cassette domain-containing protein [Thermoanaerobaculaceae bacterium]